MSEYTVGFAARGLVSAMAFHRRESATQAIQLAVIRW